jgi:integrase
MARRRYGSGSVTLRSDGRWEGQLRLPNGSRRFVYGRDRRQVVARLQEERWRIAAGIPRRVSGLTLGEYLPEWLEVCRKRLRPKTFESYALCVHRIEMRLGRVALVRLTPLMVQSAYARLEASGLASRTVFQTHAVLHRALDQALHWGLVKTNPTEVVAAPRPAQREMMALSTQQLAVLLGSSRGSRWYPLWVVLGTAGLRIGEALGLKWGDVDLNTGRLQVKRALQRQRGRGLVFVETKTPRSRRLIQLSSIALEAFREQREHATGELVFPNRYGGPQESSSVTAALRVALNRASLPGIRVHDLRHTTATVLLEAGAHPKLVQELLGHSTVAFTLNTYSHVVAGLSGEAARTIDRVLQLPSVRT